MLILGFATFFLFGCQLVVVGAYQPQLAAALGIGLRDTGLLGAAIIAGIGVGVVCAGPLVDRRSSRALFVTSTAATALALGTIDGDVGFARAATHLFFAGFGAGFYETVLNAGVVARYGDDSVKRLAFVHAAATLGGMVAPLVVLAWVDRGGDFVAGFRLLGGLHAAVAVVGGLAGRFPPPSLAGGHGPHGAARVRDWIARPAILALVVAAFFYVGGETSMTLFVIPYAEQVLALDADRGRTAISAFWLGLLSMRIVVMLAPRPAGARMLFWSATLGTVVLALGVVTRASAIEALMGLVGLCMGALFPLFVALTGQAVPEARGSAVAVVVGMGGAGGFVLPWALGFVGDVDGPRAVMGGVALACAVTAAAGLVLVRTTARAAARPSLGEGPREDARDERSPT